jgi:hypothetical protein
LIETILLFQEVFGSEFWHNVCIVCTHFSNSQEQVKIRKMQSQSKQKKAENLRKMIRDNFAKSSVLEKVAVFFTDSFDLGRHHDLTREEIK